jgi:hypothetical protein
MLLPDAEVQYCFVEMPLDNRTVVQFAAEASIPGLLVAGLNFARDETI